QGTSAPTVVTVNPTPSPVITASHCLAPFASGGTASVPDAGPGATYSWSITNGTITAGAGTKSITFSSTGAGSITLNVTVTNGCGSASGSATVAVNAQCGKFFTLTPCRVIDTRSTNTPALAAAGQRTFLLTGSCGIPSTAQAVSVNVAVTGESAGGHLQIFPAGSPLPLTSVINYRAGQTRANNAIISLGPGGDITVKCNQDTGTTDLILDVNGYFE
ncbi:MAG TPA: hypothetical protein VLO07_05690, partial [Thermoanaerobaculia bacterium]|nr:hypothetical protein [Thermoanaerobaculia bacterium]